MNESKVVPRIAHDFTPQELVVTHADYRALEELRASDAECLSKVNELLQAENYEVKEDRDSWRRVSERLEEELAALRGEPKRPEDIARKEA